MNEKRERFMKKAKKRVTEALKSRDMLLCGVTRTVDDLDKIINQLGERLEDWYAVYFPEFKLEDRMKYAELVAIIDRENPDKREMSQIIGQKKTDEIIGKMSGSMGAKIEQDDLAECQSLAGSILHLNELRARYIKYQEKLAFEICPNMSTVGGPDVAAKLVSHIGSLTKLAMLPSSTIQVLGAEKALFKHLKNRRISPPKHGIIFQHPKISNSPKPVRGKIARVLANKLSMAVKADAFTKNNIADKLKKDFEDRYAEIMRQYEKGKTE